MSEVFLSLTLDLVDLQLQESVGGPYSEYSVLILHLYEPFSLKTSFKIRYLLNNYLNRSKHGLLRLKQLLKIIH